MREAILEIIAEIDPDLTEVEPAVPLRDQGFDSMDFLDVVLGIRKRFGIEVPESDYQRLATVDSCVEYLNEMVQP